MEGLMCVVSKPPQWMVYFVDSILMFFGVFFVYWAVGKFRKERLLKKMLGTVLVLVVVGLLVEIGLAWEVFFGAFFMECG